MLKRKFSFQEKLVSQIQKIIFEKIKQTLYDTCRRTMNNENTTQWSENSWDSKEKCEDRGMFGSLMFYLKYFYVQTFSFLFSNLYPLFPPLALPYHFSFLFKYIIPPLSIMLQHSIVSFVWDGFMLFSYKDCSCYFTWVYIF